MAFLFVPWERKSVAGMVESGRRVDSSAMQSASVALTFILSRERLRRLLGCLLSAFCISRYVVRRFPSWLASSDWNCTARPVAYPFSRYGTLGAVPQSFQGNVGLTVTPPPDSDKTTTS